MPEPGQKPRAADAVDLPEEEGHDRQRPRDGDPARGGPAHHGEVGVAPGASDEMLKIEEGKEPHEIHEEDEEEEGKEEGSELPGLGAELGNDHLVPQVQNHDLDHLREDAPGDVPIVALGTQPGADRPRGGQKHDDQQCRRDEHREGVHREDGADDLGPARIADQDAVEHMPQRVGFLGEKEGRESVHRGVRKRRGEGCVPDRGMVSVLRLKGGRTEFPRITARNRRRAAGRAAP